MSPSGGLMTTVEACITWSPVNSSLLLLEQVAQVVRCMARGVDDAQRRFAGQLESLATAQCHIGNEARVLPFGVRRPPGRGNAPPVRACKRHRRGRMILVRVGREDPADRPWRRRQHCLHMLVERRAGVDHGPFVALATAHQVGVGARPGHHAAVVRGDADQARRQPHRPSGHQLVGRMAAARRDRAGRFRPTRVLPASPGAAPADRWPRGASSSGTSRGARAQVEQCRHAGVLREQLDGLECRRHQLQCGAARQRLGRAQPELFDEFGAVVRGGLTWRRGGNEEARVEALGTPGGVSQWLR